MPRLSLVALALVLAALLLATINVLHIHHVNWGVMQRGLLTDLGLDGTARRNTESLRVEPAPGIQKQEFPTSAPTPCPVAACPVCPVCPVCPICSTAAVLSGPCSAAGGLALRIGERSSTTRERGDKVGRATEPNDELSVVRAVTRGARRAYANKV